MVRSKTKYQKEFSQWLNSTHELQKLGLSDVFNWQWFLTMTSKDTMTLNGARLMMTRFLSLYLSESKTNEVSCLWVAEPHNQGKLGYHVHAIMQTQWPIPEEDSRRHKIALLIDDIYQRAMGLAPITKHDYPQYLDRYGKTTNKHRFRAEPYSKARGEYCVKYLTKEYGVLWEFARVTHTECAEDEFTGPNGLSQSSFGAPKDVKGNWDKKWARLRTKQIKHANELRKGNEMVRINQLVKQAELNYAKWSKLRANEKELELEFVFKPKPGYIVY
jgi:hypothetical protein